MEAQSAKHNIIYLENFILRSVIYKKLYATNQMQNLLKEYNDGLLQVVNKIIQGYPVDNLKILDLLELTETTEYRSLITKKINLQNEYQYLNTINKKLKNLAKYVYLSEIKLLKKVLICKNLKLAHMLQII